MQMCFQFLFCLNLLIFFKIGWSQYNPRSSDVEVKPGLRVKSEGIQPRSTVSWVTARPQQKLFPMQPSNSKSPARLSVTKPPATLPPPPSPEGPVDSALNVPPPLVVQQLPPVSWITLPSKNFYPSRKSETNRPSETQKVVIPWFTDQPKSLAASPKPDDSLPVTPSTHQAPVSWLGYPPKQISSSASPEGPAVWSGADPLEMLPVPPSTPETPDSWLGYQPKKISSLNSQGPAVSLGSPYNPEVQLGPSENTEDLFSHFQFPVEQVEVQNKPETLNSGLPPLTYPDPIFKGGRLHNYASVYEQGNLERETEDNRFVPMYPYYGAELDSPFLSMDGMLPQSAYMRPAYPNMFYYFLTGQLPHGTVSHTQTDYEVGRDHTIDFGFDRYRFTSAKRPDNPSQIEFSTLQF